MMIFDRDAARLKIARGRACRDSDERFPDPMRRLVFAFAIVAVPIAAQIEDAAARARLPEFQLIPAATRAELTPTNGLPTAESLRTWTVSHGDAGARRY